MTIERASAPPLESIFADVDAEAYPFRFQTELHVAVIVGGIPTDPHVARGFLEAKLAAKDELLEEELAKLLKARGVEPNGDIDTANEQAREAIGEIANRRYLNGFKRDENGLYIEGRQVKAALKEAGSIAVAAGKLPSRGWGSTNKGIRSFLAEHIFIEEDRVYLGVDEPTGIHQRFPKNKRTGQTSIAYEEFVNDSNLAFVVRTDQEMSRRDWAMLWRTAEYQGVGSTRSQGFGRFAVTRFDPIE